MLWIAIAALFVMVLILLLLLLGKVSLHEDWRGSHKLLSVWVSAAWSGLIGWLADNSAAGLHAWNSLPPDLRGYVPEWGRIALMAIIVFGSWFAVRLVKQPVLRRGPDGH